jgi:hypothetical protein
MIEDRIGSIGSTQGVKLNNSPRAKKMGRTTSSERDSNAAGKHDPVQGAAVLLRRTWIGEPLFFFERSP